MDHTCASAWRAIFFITEGRPASPSAYGMIHAPSGSATTGTSATETRSSRWKCVKVFAT